MPPSAASFFWNSRLMRWIWRKRVGVEPTILAAKDRINGFEGHEDHRTSFASVWIIGMRRSVFNLLPSIFRRNGREFSAGEI